MIEDRTTRARDMVTHDEDHTFNNNVNIAGILHAKHLSGPNLGWFTDLPSLQSVYPSPKIGDWACVGPQLPAPIYRCTEDGVWSKTNLTGGTETDDIRLSNIEEELAKKINGLYIFPIEGISFVQKKVLYQTTLDPSSTIVYSTYNKRVCALTPAGELCANWASKEVGAVKIPSGGDYTSLTVGWILVYHELASSRRAMSEEPTPAIEIPLPQVNPDRLLYAKSDGTLEEFITSKNLNALQKKCDDMEARLKKLEAK